MKTKTILSLLATAAMVAGLACKQQTSESGLKEGNIGADAAEPTRPPVDDRQRLADAFFATLAAEINTAMRGNRAQLRQALVPLADRHWTADTSFLPELTQLPGVGRARVVNGFLALSGEFSPTPTGFYRVIELCPTRNFAPAASDYREGEAFSFDFPNITETSGGFHVATDTVTVVPHGTTVQISVQRATFAAGVDTNGAPIGRPRSELVCPPL